MNATIDLGLFSAFVAVGEAGSFSGAAKQLGVTTATISRSIARLEAEVGTQLLHRTTRHVSLSTAGEALFERAALHVRGLASAISDLPEREEEPAGVLRLTAPYELGSILLGDLIARFVQRYPRVRVEADLSNRVVDLVAEGYDLALRPDVGKRQDSSLIARRILRGELRFYAAPSYLARRGTPRAIGSEQHEWLVFAPFQKRIAPLAKLQPRVLANDLLFLRALAKAGAGIATLPTLAADALVASGDLQVVLPSEVLPTGSLSMVYPAAGPVPRKVIAFRDHLLTSLRG